ncbi:glycosyltransferase family 4 protein [Mariprofundus erugo]|uniref:Glycosyltransferase family 4 protein n=1 Tax=Mariprofundus erugo TaxID=2528639 RepID=A0A5R9GT03_9PROT|nr:glycosyltransferase family 4 protein [Mariprofundus erugo]TLS69040.1 glycosyltransferase family 4 protein [Mariprofundus erugo]
MKELLKGMVKVALDLLFLLPAIFAAAASRFATRHVDVGLGPEPLVSYLYHKKALNGAGYSAETFVFDSNFITSDFDFNASRVLSPALILLRWHYLYFRALFRYRCLYISFHGGPLMATIVLRGLEPFLLRLAGIKVVILPYGSDVQDMTRCPNFAFTTAISKDYPLQRWTRNRVVRQIDRWTCHATHVVTGCDWIDYMYHWDSVTLNNFSIDTEFWSPVSPPSEMEGPIRILHSPNHRSIKGTCFFESAILQLKEEGFDIELIVLERQSNAEIRRVMSEVDIVADQLIIGWYAMFAMEGMALAKPVLCYLRDDLKSFYTMHGIIEEGEIPLVECHPSNVTDVIRGLISDRSRMIEIGRQSREFIIKHHSLQVIGARFAAINKGMGILPSTPVSADSRTSSEELSDACSHH